MKRLALAAAVALAAAAPAAAQEDPADRAFVATFVDAVVHGAPARLPLVHSQARACATPPVGEWWQVSAARQAREAASTRYRWTLKPVAADEQPMFAEGFDYTVQPTHVLQIVMQPRPYSSYTMLVRLAKDGDRWAEVVPCAKPEMQAKIRAALAAKAQQTEHAKSLAAAMPPALRAKVVAEIKAGREVTAAQTYARESGESLTTATEVVDVLKEASP